MMRSLRSFGRGSAWAPDASAGLIGWWHAKSGLTLDGSDRVEQWDNLVSPSGGASYLEDHPVIGSSVSPTYQATGWNSSQPTLSYAPQKRVQNSSNSQIIGFAASAAQCTIAAVLSVDAVAGVGKTLLQWTDEVSQFYAIGFAGVLGQERLVLDVNDGSPVVVSGADFTGRHTLVLSRNGGNHILWMDGVQIATPSISVNAGASTELFVGTNAVGTVGFDGLLCELCMWTAEHNNIGLAVHQYAKAKWGGLP
jgi:hypothetical protein